MEERPNIPGQSSKEPGEKPQNNPLEDIDLSADLGDEVVAFWDEEQTEEMTPPFSASKPAEDDKAKEPCSPQQAPGEELERFSDISSFLSEQFGPAEAAKTAESAVGDTSSPAPEEPQPAKEQESSSEAATPELSQAPEQMLELPLDLNQTVEQAQQQVPELQGKLEGAFFFDCESTPPAGVALGKAVEGEASQESSSGEAGQATGDAADSGLPPGQEESFFAFPESAKLASSGEDTEEMLLNQARHRKRLRPFSLLLNIISWSVLVIFFLAVGFGVLYGRYAMSRLNGRQPEENRVVNLVVEPGDRLPRIIERLRAEKLVGSYLGIDDKYLMIYIAKVNQNSNEIKHGVYRLDSAMSLNEIYDRLIKGSKDFNIVVPEGVTVREVANIALSKVETFDAERFVELTKNPSFIERVWRNVPSLEGYLYPSTYSFGPGMKEEELIRMMLKKFREEVEPKLETVEKRDSLSFHEHVVMASLIEREARVDSERPMIASVMFNRMQKGMTLDIDASVRYALNEWKRPVTYEDLKIDSPYNTYRHKGLPPGPICSPRVASILATFQPAKSEYLFYVYKGDGTHAFSKTYEEHKENVKNYRKWRAEQLAQLFEAQQGSASAGKAASGETTSVAALGLVARHGDAGTSQVQKALGLTTASTALTTATALSAQAAPTSSSLQTSPSKAIASENRRLGAKDGSTTKVQAKSNSSSESTVIVTPVPKKKPESTPKSPARKATSNKRSKK